MSNVEKVSREDLVKAYQISAQLVAEYGGEFVPVFERMERELKRLAELDEAVTRAERAVEHLDVGLRR